VNEGTVFTIDASSDSFYLSLLDRYPFPSSDLLGDIETFSVSKQVAHSILVMIAIRHKDVDDLQVAALLKSYTSHICSPDGLNDLKYADVAFSFILETAVADDPAFTEEDLVAFTLHLGFWPGLFYAYYRLDFIDFDLSSWDGEFCLPPRFSLDDSFDPVKQVRLLHFGLITSAQVSPRLRKLSPNDHAQLGPAGRFWSLGEDGCYHL